jgi:hypothetical protein
MMTVATIAAETETKIEIAVITILHFENDFLMKY